MGARTIREAIGKVVAGEHLSREEARAAMSAIMDGEATSAQIAALATALRMKGETTEEIAGFAETMRAKAARVPVRHKHLLDIVGTGGDGSNSFNISTASAIVSAAGGIRVAKHGNRAASSKTGSADAFEALGVNIQLTPEQVADCLERVGICFMFAPLHHQSLKFAAGPRKEIGIRTIFNMLGPLTNPAGADRQLIGLYDASKTELIAEVMRSLGMERGLVFAGRDGLDEISVSAPTVVSELADGKIRTYEITPEELGLGRYPLQDIVGGDAAVNARIIRDVLSGGRGAHRDIVLANAGACFYVAGRCDSLKEGVQLAASAIDSGRAMEKLEQLIRCTGEYAHVS